MRRPGWLVAVIVASALSLCSGALGAEKDPGTGGLVGTPAAPPPVVEPPPTGYVVAPAPPPAALESGAPADGTVWGVVARGGYFGLPDVIADQLFSQHPEVDGTVYGAELRYHGDGGGRGSFAVGVAIDYAETSANGIWQTDESSEPQAGSGDIDMLALTVTAYWNISPAGPVHPFVGLGLGFGYFQGSIQEDADLVEVETLLPVVHIPVGLALELGEHVQLALEARILNGIAAGGSLQIRF